MINTFQPRFIGKFFCGHCGKECNTPNQQRNHACIYDPAVAAKKAAQDKQEAQYDEVDREHNRIIDIWEIWMGRQSGLKNKPVYPSVTHEPSDQAHKGRCIIFIGYSDSFYRTAIMTNPTWGRVYRKFIESIGVTGDKHHIYLEGLRKPRKKDRPLQLRDVPEDVTVLEFSTGS